jgi:hypothetical protein
MLRGSGYFRVMSWAVALQLGMKGLMRLTRLLWFWLSGGICITYYCRVIEPRGDVGATSMVAR